MNVRRPGHLKLLLILFIAATTLAGLAMLNGWGTEIVWYPKVEKLSSIQKPSASTVGVSAPLQSYKEIWNQSLFNKNRTADPVAPNLKNEGIIPSLTGFTLTGVVISPPFHKAFLKTAEGKTLSLVEGEALPNGWIVEKIENQKISLSFRSTTQEMTLPVLKLPATSLR